MTLEHSIYYVTPKATVSEVGGWGDPRDRPPSLHQPQRSVEELPRCPSGRADKSRAWALLRAGWRALGGGGRNEVRPAVLEKSLGSVHQFFFFLTTFVCPGLSKILPAMTINLHFMRSPRSTLENCYFPLGHRFPRGAVRTPGNSGEKKKSS